MTRTFEDKPAERSGVPILIGLIGPSGSGKTKSALRLAEGIQSVNGGDIFAIDTESRRLEHYADQHKFRHIDFKAPFGSLDYLAAMQHCVSKGAGVVIVDSMTHEHSGPGGYLDLQEQELTRMAGTDYGKRERMKMLAWQKPSQNRQRLINGILQLNCAFIFCFRAKEKAKPVKKDGKTEIIDLGFMPIAGDDFLFEMNANCLLLPKSEGVPSWRSDQIGERMMMKLPNYLAHAFPDGEPLSEQTGRALANWAKGNTTTKSKPSPPAETTASRPASSDQAPQDDAGQDIDSDVTRLFHEHVAGRIKGATDHVDLISWWNSEAQKTQRANLLTDQEIAAYKAQVLARKTELQGASHVG